MADSLEDDYSPSSSASSATAVGEAANFTVAEVNPLAALIYFHLLSWWEPPQIGGSASATNAGALTLLVRYPSPHPYTLNSKS